MKLNYKGRVRWFNKHFGYGFITHEDGQDVFAHYSVIDQQGHKKLEVGELVYYNAEITNNGLKATELERGV